VSRENGDAGRGEPVVMLHCHCVEKPLGQLFLSEMQTGAPIWVFQRHAEVRAEVRQVLTDPRLNRASCLDLAGIAPTVSGDNRLPGNPDPSHDLSFGYILDCDQRRSILASVRERRVGGTNGRVLTESTLHA
jgi:hypothetical protein